MRKRLITPTPENIQTHEDRWLDVERAATIEITSEDKEFPIEAAFVSGVARGWRAATPGSQTIRLIFDQPQKLSRISLVFEETEFERTQESILRCSRDSGSSFTDIVRQQSNFNPPDRYAKPKNFKWNSPVLLFSN